MRFRDFGIAFKKYLFANAANLFIATLKASLSIAQLARKSKYIRERGIKSSADAKRFYRPSDEGLAILAKYLAITLSIILSTMLNRFAYLQFVARNCVNQCARMIKSRGNNNYATVIKLNRMSTNCNKRTFGV